MAPSQEANNVIGALGGAVLAACLAPQLWKLYRTRSARDLSYIYLAMYCTGLLLTFVYLYYEGALTGWICVLVELGFACTTAAIKFWLDHCGPRSAPATPQQQSDESSPGAKRASPSEVRITVNALRDSSAHGPPPVVLSTPPGLRSPPPLITQ